MARVRVALGIGALCVAGVALVSGQRREPVESRAAASISGRVTVAGETPAVPIRRARVRLDGDTHDSGRFTDTDTDGGYRFNLLPAGAYRITADKPGYVTLSAGASRPFTRPPPIRLMPGEAKAVDMALPRGAALEGRITGEAGEPAQNAPVAAVRLVAAAEGRRPVVVARSLTDDLGRFRLHSLPAGEYFIEASVDPASPVALSASSSGPHLGLARSYYPGLPGVSDAQSVRLTTGEERGGFDFELAIMPMARLTIRVLDRAGHVPLSANCRVQAVGGPIGGVRGYSVPPALNVCTFPAVPPGEYWLLGAARPAAGAPAEFAASRMSASGQDLGEVVLRTSPGAVIDGEIDTEGSDPRPSLAGVSLAVHRMTYDLPSPDRGSAGLETSITIAADGRFVIPSLFGPVVFRLNGLPEGWVLAGAWLDGRDVTDSVTEMRTAERHQRLQLRITRRTARLVATLAPDGSPVPPDARVIVFSADERLWTAPSRFVHVSGPDADGHFTVDALLPGAYYVAAREYVEDDSWHDRTLLHRLRDGAASVSLAAGDSASVAVNMGRVP